MTDTRRPHVARLTVRGYHCDAYGHVNNARWLELFEEARWRLLEGGGALARLHDAGYGFVVVRIEVDYRRPAVPEDVLEIRSRLDHVGGRSAVIRQQAVRVGRVGETGSGDQGVGDTARERLLAEAAVTFVVVERATGRPAALAGEVREALAATMPNDDDR